MANGLRRSSGTIQASRTTCWIWANNRGPQVPQPGQVKTDRPGPSRVRPAHGTSCHSDRATSPWSPPHSWGSTSVWYLHPRHRQDHPAMRGSPRHNRQRRDTPCAYPWPGRTPPVSQLGQNTANKILPHSRACFVPTATNKDPPCTPLGRCPIKFSPIPTPESFVKNRTQGAKFPGRIFFPTSTPTYPLIRI